MLNAFVTLFTGADWLFYLLLIISISLFVAEVFIPGFGIAGLGGVLSTVATVTERCVHGNNSSNEILLYILYIVLIISLVSSIVKWIYAIHKAKKNRPKFRIVDGNQIPLTESGNLDYSFLIGKEGEVVSDLHPIGKVNIDGGIYEVTTAKEYIYTGTVVVVEDIFGQRIVVKRKNKKEE